MVGADDEHVGERHQAAGTCPVDLIEYLECSARYWLTGSPSAVPPAANARGPTDGAIRPMMRSRSSTEANSTTIFPLRRPSSTLTRVSNVSDRRSARSEIAGAVTRSEEHT